GEALHEKSPTAFEEYKADKPTKFLVLPKATGLDGKKLGDVQKKLTDAREELAKSGNTDREAASQKLTESERDVHAASITGDRRTLVADSLIPATMAVIYLGLLVYFKTIGGYRPIHIDDEPALAAASHAGEG